MKIHKSILVVCVGMLLLVGVGCDKGTEPEKQPLDLTYPTGGEVLTAGTAVTIKWDVNSDRVGSVGVALSVDDGLSWSELSARSISPSTAKQLSWTPITAQKSTTCKIKVYQYDDQNTFDISNKFTIQ